MTGTKGHAGTLEAMEFATPVGALAVIVDDGVVVASGFTTVEDQFERLDPDLQARGLRKRSAAGPVALAVRAYLGGDPGALDQVPVRQPGGAFMQDAWRVMREIPPGQTWSYTELAGKAGRPEAVRPAAAACTRNLVAPFVPCHRVVRSDGSMGGYYYGLAVKRWLLAHERGEPTQELLPA
jgi:methylated-DNA-[protein]-cysteine S-methyltransferase